MILLLSPGKLILHRTYDPHLRSTSFPLQFLWRIAILLSVLTICWSTYEASWLGMLLTGIWQVLIPNHISVLLQRCALTMREDRQLTVLLWLIISALLNTGARRNPVN
jgi:hypothetical protein